jgi:carbonic anhydrase/acetyltransferase-like protein (isoleucine patch superfamily)
MSEIYHRERMASTPETIGFFPEKIHPDAFVAPNATVIGDVTLEAGVSIWFGAVLRGDVDRIVIGEGSNVQENSVIHCDSGYPTLVGRNVIIGHAAVVHGCTIEDNVLIGMHATILSGAHIGEGAMIAAGALVPAGARIPPRTLYKGVPARFARPVREDEVETIRLSAQRYRERARRYKQFFARQNAAP